MSLMSFSFLSPLNYMLIIPRFFHFFTYKWMNRRNWSYRCYWSYWSSRTSRYRWCRWCYWSYRSYRCHWSYWPSRTSRYTWCRWCYWSNRPYRCYWSYWPSRITRYRWCRWCNWSNRSYRCYCKPLKVALLLPKIGYKYLLKFFTLSIKYYIIMSNERKVMDNDNIINKSS